MNPSTKKLGNGIIKWWEKAIAKSSTPGGKPKPAASSSPTSPGQHRANPPTPPYHSRGLNRFWWMKMAKKYWATTYREIFAFANLGLGFYEPLGAITNDASKPISVPIRAFILRAMGLCEMKTGITESPVVLTMFSMSAGIASERRR